MEYPENFTSQAELDQQAFEALQERVKQLEQEVAALKGAEERVFERLRKAFREARASYVG